MGLRYPGQKAGGSFFVTSTYHDWAEYNERFALYRPCAESLTHYARRDLALIIGYVLMPNHVHILLAIDGSRLGRFMRDFKKFISQKAARDAGIPAASIWMTRYDRQVVESVDVLRTKLEYIHENPVRAGLVRTAEEWPWSSAADYHTGRSGPVEVCKDWFI